MNFERMKEGRETGFDRTQAAVPDALLTDHRVLHDDCDADGARQPHEDAEYHDHVDAGVLGR